MNKDERKYILVVDDSPIIRHSLKQFFKEYDIEIVMCENGLDGVKKAIAYKPCLIFLDLIMPEFNGIKMLQVVKAMDELNAIPIIVMSANTNRSNVITALKLGADKVIKKPMHKEILIRSINSLLGENFLKLTKKTNILKNAEKAEVTKSLRKYFLKSFEFKKKSIEKALKAQDKEFLLEIFHQIKGEGGMIGFNEITELSRLTEEELRNEEEVNWNKINNNFEVIYSLVNSKELLNPILEK